MTEDDLFRNDLPNQELDTEPAEDGWLAQYVKIGLGIVGLYGASVLLLSVI
jgi:hypothetical protein